MVNMGSCCIKLSFLPNKLSTETDNDRLDRVFNEFDVLINNLLAKKVDGKKIVIADYGVSDNIRAYFNHIIHYDATTGKFNNTRLMACCFLPLIFEHCYISVCQLSHNRVSHNNKKRKTLYCEAKHFVIVYEERENSIYLITGYHISKKEKHKFL